MAPAIANGPYCPFSYQPQPVEALKDFMAEIDLYACRRLIRFQPESLVNRAHPRVGDRYPRSGLDPHSALGPLSVRPFMALGYLLAPRPI